MSGFDGESVKEATAASQNNVSSTVENAEELGGEPRQSGS